MNAIETSRTKICIVAVLVITSFVVAYGKATQTSRPNQSSQSTGTSSSGAASQPAGRGTTPILVSPEEDYRIGLNDVLEIKVENAPELTQTYRVTAAGTFLMPWIGRVTAVNKTTEELAQFITDKLKGDFLRDPKVTVLVKEFNSRSFWVQGSVRNPGVFQVEGTPSMLELLTLAGWLTEHHGANAYIIRRLKSAPVKAPEGGPAKTGAQDGGNGETSPEAPKYEMFSVNLNALLRGNFDQNVVLEAGDTINIPPSDVFFVAGEVNTPGSFSLKEGTTLRQAISLAQGTNFKAALNRGIIFRENNAGKREELHVDIDAIMKGKKEDLAIMANDIIVVPNSRTKSIGGAVLRAFGLSAITRVPIP